MGCVNRAGPSWPFFHFKYPRRRHSTLTVERSAGDIFANENTQKHCVVQTAIHGNAGQAGSMPG